jgi:uncharacterized repeat protein (TIGR02543 family)
VPSPGYVFDNWTGHTEGLTSVNDNPASLLMGDREDNNRVITANFSPSDIRCTVILNSYPSAGGSLTCQPGQTSQGFLINETITITATPQTGYVFNRWAGDLAGTQNPGSILVSDNKMVGAYFYPTVSVDCSPADAGSADLNPASSTGYEPGTQVTITATAADGYEFSGWEGDASGSEASLTITVSGPRTITARFVEQSSSRWWIWVIVGLAALLGALALLGLLYPRTKKGAPGPSRPG